MIHSLPISSPRIDAIRVAGLVDGRHYTEYVESVKQLKREKRHEEAIALLMRLVEAVEREAQVAGKGWAIAPWYYHQLGVIYRKQKNREAETAIAERYRRQFAAQSAI